jgi:hypothetical protein
MIKPTVSKEYDLIEFKGQMYMVPMSVDIRNDLGLQEDVLKRRDIF